MSEHRRGWRSRPGDRREAPWREKGEGGGYLREGKGVRYGADEDLPQLAVQVRTLDAVQVSVHPEDPATERNTGTVNKLLMFRGENTKNKTK